MHQTKGSDRPKPELKLTNRGKNVKGNSIAAAQQKSNPHIRSSNGISDLLIYCEYTTNWSVEELSFDFHLSSYCGLASVKVVDADLSALIFLVDFEGWCMQDEEPLHLAHESDKIRTKELMFSPTDNNTPSYFLQSQLSKLGMDQTEIIDDVKSPALKRLHCLPSAFCSTRIPLRLCLCSTGFFPCSAADVETVDADCKPIAAEFKTRSLLSADLQVVCFPAPRAFRRSPSRLLSVDLQVVGRLKSGSDDSSIQTDSYLFVKFIPHSADIKKTVFFLQTANVWSTTSVAVLCRCGPQTAAVLTSKKQTETKSKKEVSLQIAEANKKKQQERFKTSLPNKNPRNCKFLLTTKSVESTSLALQSINNVHGGYSFPASMLGVCDGITDDIFKKDLQNSTGLLVDKATNTLNTSSSGETADRRLGDTLDVVPENLTMTLGSSLS
ncbi:hypothetical protein LXL04_002840 [Taraxacum kok-saghyz]